MLHKIILQYEAFIFGVLAAIDAALEVCATIIESIIDGA